MEKTPTAPNCKNRLLFGEYLVAHSFLFPPLRPLSVPLCPPSPCVFHRSFITYAACQHLDGKHTIFGRVVGGFKTLDKMEAVPCNEKERPLEEIKILGMEVLVDPYVEYEKKEIMAKTATTTTTATATTTTTTTTGMQGGPEKLSGLKRAAADEPPVTKANAGDRSRAVSSSATVGKYVSAAANKPPVSEKDLEALGFRREAASTTTLSSTTTATTANTTTSSADKKRKIRSNTNLNDFSG